MPASGVVGELAGERLRDFQPRLSAASSIASGPCMHVSTPDGTVVGDYVAPLAMHDGVGVATESPCILSCRAG